jgi:hypothetical protein
LVRGGKWRWISLVRVLQYVCALARSRLEGVQHDARTCGKGPEIKMESFGMARRERSRMNRWVRTRPLHRGSRTEERSVEWWSVRVPATLRAHHEMPRANGRCI